MEIRWLGWAGVELTAGDDTLVIDPLADAAAVFAWLGPDASASVPAVAEPTPGSALAGLVTHLHRDHADAAALTAALRPGAPVFEPRPGGGDQAENLAVAQAEHELGESGLERRRFGVWEPAGAGRSGVTALPAVDGTGDPQVAWLVEAEGTRVLHLGDTLFHGYWWRMARRHGPFDVVLVPVNGAVVGFPHRPPPSPRPAPPDPAQARSPAGSLAAPRRTPSQPRGSRS